jgi:hypothetical protein
MTAVTSAGAGNFSPQSQALAWGVALSAARACLAPRLGKTSADALRGQEVSAGRGSGAAQEVKATAGGADITTARRRVSPRRARGKSKRRAKASRSANAAMRRCSAADAADAADAGRDCDASTLCGSASPRSRASGRRARCDGEVLARRRCAAADADICATWPTRRRAPSLAHAPSPQRGRARGSAGGRAGGKGSPPTLAKRRSLRMGAGLFMGASMGRLRHGAPQTRSD